MRGDWFDTTADITNEAQDGTSWYSSLDLSHPPVNPQSTSELQIKAYADSRRRTSSSHRPQTALRQRRILRPTNLRCNNRARRGHGTGSSTVYLPGREEQRELAVDDQMLQCKSVLQALVVTAPDNLELVHSRTCIYCCLLASKQLSAVFHQYIQRPSAATSELCQYKLLMYWTC